MTTWPAVDDPSCAPARSATVKATDSSQAICSAHYTGTCSIVANNFPNRLFNFIGATEVEPL